MTNELYGSQVKEEENLYIVSPKKFVILFASTLGIYSTYWFYKQWDLYKKRTNGTQWPVMRGLFPIFFAHSLFSILSAELQEKSNGTSKNFNKYATIFVVVAIFSYIFNQLASNDIGSPFTDVVTYLTLPLTCWVLYQMQLVVNVICDDSLGESNNSYTIGNYFLDVFGRASVDTHSFIAFPNGIFLNRNHYKLLKRNKTAD